MYVNTGVGIFRALLYVFTGIGRDIAVTLYRRGARTVALSRTQADLDLLQQEVRPNRYGDDDKEADDDDGCNEGNEDDLKA